MKRVSFMIACLAIFSVLSAQTKDSRWAVGLHGNITDYKGDLGGRIFSFENMKAGGSLSLAYYLSPTFDITAKGSYATSERFDDNGTYSKGGNGYADRIGTPLGDWGFENTMWQATANLKMKLNNGWLFSEDAVIGPFFIGGVGVTRSESEMTRTTHSEKTYSNLTFYYGGGLNFRLSERLNMVLEVGVYNPMTDVYDGIDATTAPGWKGAGTSDDKFFQYSLGLNFNLGKKADTDSDGIADKKDKCPNTPIGVAVDENGCPIDTDGDGVADYLDKCPKLAGTINGCPDTDSDGIIDSNDKCPKVAGLKQLQGCPDKDDDNDGVLNLQDKCPNTPKGVKVDSKGCPVDTDSDGIADYLDKCPNEAGPAKTQGCPVQAKLDEFAKKIYFNTNKSSLKTESFNILNQVVDILKKHNDANFKVVINGHTDSVGRETYNQKLSEKRAAIVKNYLIEKGIAANKLFSRGYGETRPIASNDTKAGRAQNRRTEIIVE